MASDWEAPVILDMASLLSASVKILSVTAFHTAYLRIAASKPYRQTDDERDNQHDRNQHGWTAFARDLQVHLGLGKLPASFRQRGLQLPPVVLDLLFHVAEMTRSAGQFSFQTK